jgi:replicative DNA helicase
VTVSDQLKKNNEIDNIWGMDYLYELSSFLLSTSSCWEYAKIVKDKSVLRNILKVSQKNNRRCLSSKRYRRSFGWNRKENIWTYTTKDLRFNDENIWHS